MVEETTYLSNRYESTIQSRRKFKCSSRDNLNGEAHELFERFIL